MTSTDPASKDVELFERVRRIRHAQRVQRWESLVAIQSRGTRLPIFGVHALNGQVYFFHKLADLLGPDQPVYGLRARGLDTRSQPLERIADMAAAYLDEVKRVQPSGPYVIVGRCNGSRIAFEMAQQLTRSGETVATLCLVDPGPVPVRMTTSERVQDLLRYVRYHSARGRLPRAIHRSLLPRLRRLRAIVRERRDHLQVGRLRSATRHRSGADFLRRELSSPRHREQPYPGRILFFTATETPRHVDPAESWSRFAALDVVPIAADHLSIGVDHLPLVAEALARHLDTLQSSAPTNLAR